jgi:thioredoxin
MRSITSFLLLLLATFSCRSQQPGYTLGALSFKEKMDSVPGAILLDVRSHQEMEGGYIANALNIDYNKEGFNKAINELDKSKSYFVYCLSGGRSSAAAGYMRSHGFTTVYDLKGGLLAWENKSLPLFGASSTPVPDKISHEQYQQIISGDSIVLIDFYATWCAPCRRMEPMLAALSKEYKGKATILGINIEENKQLAKNLEVEEVPVFKLYRNGKETWAHQGALEKEVLIKKLNNF